MADSLSEIKNILAGLDLRVQEIASQQSTILKGIQTAIDLHPRFSSMENNLLNLSSKIDGLNSNANTGDSGPQVQSLSNDVLRLTDVVNKLNEPMGGYTLDARFESINKALTALQDTVAGFQTDINTLKTDSANMKTTLAQYSASHKTLAAVLTGFTPSGSGSQTPAPASPRGSSTTTQSTTSISPPQSAPGTSPESTSNVETAQPPQPTDSNPPQTETVQTPASVDQTPVLQVNEPESYPQPASSPRHGPAPVPTIN